MVWSNKLPPLDIYGGRQGSKPVSSNTVREGPHGALSQLCQAQITVLHFILNCARFLRRIRDHFASLFSFFLSFSLLLFFFFFVFFFHPPPSRRVFSPPSKINFLRSSRKQILDTLNALTVDLRVMASRLTISGDESEKSRISFRVRARYYAFTDFTLVI